jgi:F-type H+-transporting ATPase subunit epsilon
MILEIITPENKLYSGEVDMVTLPGVDGSFQLLNNHAPIVSTLAAGTVRITESKSSAGEAHDSVVRDSRNDKELSLEISGGVIEMSKNKAIVLAN